MTFINNKRQYPLPKSEKIMVSFFLHPFLTISSFLGRGSLPIQFIICKTTYQSRRRENVKVIFIYEWVKTIFVE